MTHVDTNLYQSSFLLSRLDEKSVRDAATLTNHRKSFSTQIFDMTTQVTDAMSAAASAAAAAAAAATSAPGMNHYIVLLLI
jgi:hypothetical protein